jgi:hypothetical protein
MGFTNNTRQEDKPRNWQDLQARLLALYTDELSKDNINMQKCIEIGEQIIHTGALLDQTQKTIQELGA